MASNLYAPAREESPGIRGEWNSPDNFIALLDKHCASCRSYLRQLASFERRLNKDDFAWLVRESAGELNERRGDYERILGSNMFDFPGKEKLIIEYARRCDSHNGCCYRIFSSWSRE